MITVQKFLIFLSYCSLERSLLLHNTDLSKPLVSVVMTIFNGDRFLAQSINCVINQTYQNWELLVIENGSKDRSVEILNQTDDARIKKHLFHDNIGRTPALQFGLEHALGKYVAVLDADDLCADSRLAEQVDFLENHEEVMVAGTWFDEIDSAGKITQERRPPTENLSIIDMMAFSNPILHSSSMFRRIEAMQVGGYEKKYKYGADTNLWVALMAVGDAEIIPKNLASYRMYPENLTNQKNYAKEVYRDGFLVYQRAARELPISNSARRRNRHTVTACEVLLGRALVRENRIVEGCWHIFRGLFRDPVGVIRSNRVRSLIGLPERSN